jgi:hypothetical protein
VLGFSSERKKKLINNYILRKNMKIIQVRSILAVVIFILISGCVDYPAQYGGYSGSSGNQNGYGYPGQQGAYRNYGNGPYGNNGNRQYGNSQRGDDDNRQYGNDDNGNYQGNQPYRGNGYDRRNKDDRD